MKMLTIKCLVDEVTATKNQCSQLLRARLIRYSLLIISCRFRYRLGVGEGSLDLPTGNCFPLESNGDYLNGISFHKGCYIGQELTARTHHTGVVRKRLMPLIFEQSTSTDDVQQIKPEAKILNESNDNVGKFRNACGNVGLALLRIEEALKSNQLYVQTHDGNSLKCKTTKPDWWMDKNSNILGEIREFQPAPAS